MERSYTLISTSKDLADFQLDLSKTDEIGYDIETYGLDWFSDDIRLAQYEVNGNI